VKAAESNLAEKVLAEIGSVYCAKVRESRLEAKEPEEVKADIAGALRDLFKRLNVSVEKE
jgi:hypothetical protein